MELIDEVKQSLMNLILENNLEPQFNELFNKYKKPEKDKGKFKIKNHLINEDKVLLNEEFFAYILLDNSSIKPQVYSDLIKLVYSNLTISRLTIKLDGYNNLFSFLTLSLMNKNIKLTKEQKQFVIKEATSKDTASHVNNGLDIRYFMLQNGSWSLDEKLDIIPKIYDSLTIEQKMLELKNNIHKKTVEKYEVETLFNLIYEDYYCLLKDTDDASKVWDDVHIYQMLYLYKQKANTKAKEDINSRMYKREDGE